MKDGQCAIANMAEAPPKFCKDCKHCSVNRTRPTFWGYLFCDKPDMWMCVRPDAEATEREYLVTGVRRPVLQEHGFCDTQRRSWHELTCGPEAKYWEPK